VLNISCYCNNSWIILLNFSFFFHFCCSILIKCVGLVLIKCVGLILIIILNFFKFRIIYCQLVIKNIIMLKIKIFYEIELC
jgi:hypothetical protein